MLMEKYLSINKLKKIKNMNEKKLKKMDLEKLKSVLCDMYIEHAAENGISISLHKPYSIPLLAEMDDEQRKQLQSGKGNPIAEMHQINSSAGMAFNYYKLFEEAQGVRVGFEWRESVPLTKCSSPAHIDVQYEKDGTIYFVECKFLEPYYSDCEINKASYYEANRYPFTEHADKWVDLIRKEDEFKYYNIAQLFRHMIAIYRHVNENPKLYTEKKIVFNSVIWNMPDSFMKRYNELENGKNAKSNNSRRETLLQEKKKAEEIINNFAKQINWTNFSFKSECYNDILGDIEGAKRYSDFIEQYHMDR